MKYCSEIICGILALLLLYGCKDDTESHILDCTPDGSSSLIDQRIFGMGFTTWSFGPNVQDREDTYGFISQNADCYTEQIDNKIPWDAWITDSALPNDFLYDISYRVSKRLPNHKLVLSVSLLNLDRSDLLEDYNGVIPIYTALNDKVIEDAYCKHLDYLINQLDPDFLIMAMEVNELRIKSKLKWGEYVLLMKNIRERIRTAHPALLLSESVTLHNWYDYQLQGQEQYTTEISDYVNNNLDFVAISFYPFMKGMHSKDDFQKAFNFLHTITSKRISFVETAHISENLDIEGLDVHIQGDVCEQKDYLDVLLENAYLQDYYFVTWWSHRDYDRFWETFPDEIKDIGQIWRDTGVLDESGKKRPAFYLWQSVLDN